MGRQVQTLVAPLRTYPVTSFEFQAAGLRHDQLAALLPRIDAPVVRQLDARMVAIHGEVRPQFNESALLGQISVPTTIFCGDCLLCYR